jgi:hypothetical protein
VAIVFATRAEFDRCLAAHRVALPDQLVGFYSIQTNRMFTYDQSSSTAASGENERMFQTIVHEAVHQTAFNCGIHSRFQESPRWWTEGLATLFEAKGIYQPGQNRQPRDRIVATHFQTLMQRVEAGEHRGSLKRMIGGDQWFETDPPGAYAFAWGWTYFLMETRADAFQQFMSRMNQRSDFSQYSAEQRTGDFTRAFGDEFDELEARFKSFFEKLAAHLE